MLAGSLSGLLISEFPASSSGWSAGRQGAGEAQLMTVWIVHVEVALTPRGVGWLGSQIESRVTGPPVDSIDVIHPEHHSSPKRSRPSSIRSTGRSPIELEVEVTGADPESGERRVLSPIQQTKTERAVEADCSIHVCRQQRHRANGFDRARVLSHCAQLCKRLLFDGSRRVWLPNAQNCAYSGAASFPTFSRR